MQDRRISIVVPSYNRGRYLDVLLTSLTWSAVRPDGFEVIVVNDGGTDDLTGVAERWRGRGLDVRLLTLRVGGLPRNNARARNLGLAEARYPLVIQTDPDIVFVDDILQAVQTRVTPDALYSCDGYFPLTEADTHALALAAGAAPARHALRRAALGRPNQVDSPDGVGGLHGAFACATDVVRGLGGYDESFEYWGWEDRELLVTAAASGLPRQRMPATQVVHLWHPTARGDLGRDVLAARGLVSRAAWDVQMQRVAAEYPRPTRVQPAPRPAVDAGDGPVPYDLDAFERWRSSDDEKALAQATLPRGYQMCFDALCGEADALAALGHTALARDVVQDALRRPWEPGDRSPEPGLSLYTRVDEALERLVWYEHALGRPLQRDVALDALARSKGGTVRAAAARTRLALAAGDRSAAASAAAVLARHAHTAGDEALVLECLLIDDRRKEAAAQLRRVLHAAEAGDFFDRIRAQAYVRLLSPGRPSTATDRAGTDRSEFLFSVGVRSQRAGLEVAAAELFRTFLDEGGPVEPRVRSDCAARLTAVEARLARVGYLCSSDRTKNAPFMSLTAT